MFPISEKKNVERTFSSLEFTFNEERLYFVEESFVQIYTLEPRKK